MLAAASDPYRARKGYGEDLSRACPVCHHLTKGTRIRHVQTWHDQVVVFDHVPAEVCDHWRDLLAGWVVDRINNLLWSKAPATQTLLAPQYYSVGFPRSVRCIHGCFRTTQESQEYGLGTGLAVDTVAMAVIILVLLVGSSYLLVPRGRQTALLPSRSGR